MSLKRNQSQESKKTVVNEEEKVMDLPDSDTVPPETEEFETTQKDEGEFQEETISDFRLSLTQETILQGKDPEHEEGVSALEGEPTFEISPISVDN